MRRVLGVLSEGDAPLEPQPGGPGLETLVERFRAAGLPVVAEGLGTPLPPDTGFQLTVYRVVQEALTNALRHAPGTPRVDLTISRDAGAITIRVVDQGARVPATQGGGTGHGLVGMAERVQVFGGTVTSGPWADGWRVVAVLPWTQADS
jgi:signal transduction histidine kinase